ncbi:MAG: putative aqr protein, partial [Streblomastix strix]
MTCTHAGIARTELVKSGFSYTTLIMEEAAQAMEIETFIPLTMSAVKNNTNQIREKESEERRIINYRSTEGLRRIVLLGDHHQIPPVVQNPDLIRFSNFDQPLFTRMIRLIDNQQINENGDSKNKDNNASVVIWLDKQGRCRKSIADLFRYRYNNLGDLPIVGNQTEEQKEEDTDDMKEKQNHLLPQPYNTQSSSQQTLLHLNPFTRANPGFQYEYQFIDVGGNQPIELNLRYPQEKITILAAYNGQKALLREMIEKECSFNPLYGRPSRLTTID